VSTANEHPTTPSRPAAPVATDAGAALRQLVDGMGFEVMPFKSTEESVARFVSVDVPLTVTTTAARGLDATIDLAERLRARGYRVAPHLAARQVEDEEHVARIVERLRAADIDRVFVIGGDLPHPAGIYHDALGLLRALDTNGHSLASIGIGGYPEGHGTIPAAAVNQALHEKAPFASHLVTQMCFHAATTVGWQQGLVRDGVTLPVYVGMPGPVHRQKLIRITANIGLGQSARFLHKQQGIWRFLVPGAYDPTKLVRRLAREAWRARGDLAGLHIFTFNELEGAAAWRRRLRAQVGLD
jgi:methylenetetrahydrofolate reductase (NADPH)